MAVRRAMHQKKEQERKTDSMKESLLRNCRSASQKTTGILWNMKVHYCVHKSSSLIPVRSQICTVHDRLPDLTYISMLSCHQRRFTKSSLFPLGFPIKILHPFPVCPTYLIAIDFITQIFGKECKTWISSCSFYSAISYFLSHILKYSHCRPVLE